jgi:hypothetical protein
MWKSILAIVAAGAIIAVLVSDNIAQDEKPAYGGVATCKACHMTTKSGAAFKKWQAGPHSKAFETLKNAQSKEIAAKMGIDDPTTADACLKCHVTAHGVDASLIGPKFSIEEGVSCEACHGPGSLYKSRKVMQDITDGKVDGATLGLIEPTEEVCVSCHNEESPTYKKFDFAVRVKEIAHPRPDK